MMLKKTILAGALLLAPLAAFAEGSEDEQGWSVSQRFQGSSNSLGAVMKTSSTATYSFSQHVKAYAGVPFYFAKEASSAGASQFMNGIGNVYSGLYLTTANSTALHYTSDLVFSLPTGDESRGFSTGHPTIDWNNTFSHSFSRVTPFAGAGIANTISDTSFFVRPFTSKGIVSHFEMGTLLDFTSRVSLGASAYAVRATGQQEIISKVVDLPAAQSATPQQAQQQSSSTNPVSTLVNNTGNGNGTDLGNVLGHNGISNSNSSSIPPVFQTEQQTVGPAQIANDQGFSTWLTLRPTSTTDLQIGYSRSAAYHLDSLFFGVGFHFGHGISVIK